MKRLFVNWETICPNNGVCFKYLVTKLPQYSLFLQMLVHLEIANVLTLRILSCICIEGIFKESIEALILLIYFQNYKALVFMTYSTIIHGF